MVPQNNGMGEDTLQLIEEPRLLLDTNFLADVLQKFYVVNRDS